MWKQTREAIKLKQLFDALDKLLKCIHSDLTTNERKFILSVKELRPDWELLGLDGIDRLPAVQWKLQNLEIFPYDVFNIFLRHCYHPVYISIIV
ncbi:hypothetical protein ES703_32399 [subsurface metagenome]